MQDGEIRQMSTGELVRRLVNNVSSLVDHEAELAKAGYGAGEPERPQRDEIDRWLATRQR